MTYTRYIKFQTTLKYNAITYTPKAYFPLIIEFIGKFEHGGRRAHKKETCLNPIYFPSICIEAYNLTFVKGIEKTTQPTAVDLHSVEKIIQDIFIKNNILLPIDCFRPLNLATNNQGNYILIDIEINGIKYI